MNLGRHNFRKNTADNDLRMCSCFNRKRPILCSDLFFTFQDRCGKTGSEPDDHWSWSRRCLCSIWEEVEYKVSYPIYRNPMAQKMEFEKGYDILLRWPTNIHLNWQVCIRSSGLLVYWFHRGKFGKRATCWIFSTPSTLLATIQISRVLNTHPPTGRLPGCGSMCPIRSPGGNASAHGVSRW